MPKRHILELHILSPYNHMTAWPGDVKCEKRCQFHLELCLNEEQVPFSQANPQFSGGWKEGAKNHQFLNKKCPSWTFLAKKQRPLTLHETDQFTSVKIVFFWSQGMNSLSQLDGLLRFPALERTKGETEVRRSERTPPSTSSYSLGHHFEMTSAEWQSVRLLRLPQSDICLLHHPAP